MLIDVNLTCLFTQVSYLCQMSIKRKLFLILYYGLATHLPDSYSKFGGSVWNCFRIFCVKRIFKKCGRVSTIGRGVYFGTGEDVEIGDYSGMGPHCFFPSNIRIGNYVMTAPEIHVLKHNHRFDIPHKSIGAQGYVPSPPVEIGDNVWIGQRAIILPGRKIANGSIIGAGSVVTKDFEPNRVIAGNPARVVRNRYENDDPDNYKVF